MTIKLKAKVEAALKELLSSKGPTPNPERKSNAGKALYEIFIWQETSAFAKKQLEAAWQALYDAGLIKSDDELRGQKGEYIAVESSAFSCLVKVSAPRTSIDKDAFLDAVARRARISREALEELWDANQKVGAASLSKRVLEA